MFELNLQRAVLSDFTKAIEISPPFPVAYTNRGLAKEYRGDIEGAIADYTKAIEISPRHADAYYNRGFARQDRGDLDGSRADFAKASEIDPQKYGPNGLRNE